MARKPAIPSPDTKTFSERLLAAAQQLLNEKRDVLSANAVLLATTFEAAACEITPDGQVNFGIPLAKSGIRQRQFDAIERMLNQGNATLLGEYIRNHGDPALAKDIDAFSIVLRKEMDKKINGRGGR